MQARPIQSLATPVEEFQKFTVLRNKFNPSKLHLVLSGMKVYIPDKDYTPPQRKKSVLQFIKSHTGPVYFVFGFMWVYFIAVLSLTWLFHSFGLIASLSSIAFTTLLSLNSLRSKNKEEKSTLLSTMILRCSLQELMNVLRENKRLRESKQIKVQKVLQLNKQLLVYEQVSQSEYRVIQVKKSLQQEIHINMYSSNLPLDYQFLILLQFTLTQNKFQLNHEPSLPTLPPPSQETQKVSPYLAQLQDLEDRYRQAQQVQFVAMGLQDEVYRGTFVSQRGLLMVKSEGIVDVPMQQLFKFLLQYKNISHYDSNFQKHEVIETLNKNCQLTYMAYKGIFPVSGRDFVNLFYKTISPDEAYIISKGIVHPHKPSNKLVRGSLFIGGFHLKREGNKTLACYIVEVDLCGSVPQAINNKVQSLQAGVVCKLKKLAKQKTIS